MQVTTELFQDMVQADVDAVYGLMRSRSYCRGSLIFNAGEPAEYLYFLKEGLVTVSYSTPDGREKLLSIYEAGDLFGQLFIGKHPYRIGRAKVISACEVGKLSQEDLQQLIEQSPQFGMNLIAYLADQQRELLAQMHAMSYPDARMRLLSMMLCLSRRLCCTNDDQFVLNPHISQNDIANLCGMSRSTVSELINEFRRNGVLGGTGRQLVVKRSVVEETLRQQGFEVLV